MVPRPLGRTQLWEPWRAWQANSRGLGDKTEQGRGWEDFEHMIFPHQEWIVLQELEVSLGTAPPRSWFPRVGRR